MTRVPVRCGSLVAAVAGLVLVLGGCAAQESSGSAAPSAAGVSAASPAPGATAQAGPDQPFGTGCGGIPAAGEGSFAGMADDRVATAMAHNPAVSVLATTIQAAHLTESFDAQEDVTVLAPADAAFAAVPPDALQGLQADTPRLTALLTHHVIQGRLTPDRLAGTHTTLNNDMVTIDVSPEAFTIAAEGTVRGKAEARVVCGNIQTANATIYLIDQVLTPAAP